MEELSAGAAEVHVVPDTFAPQSVGINPANGAFRGVGFRTIRIGFSESMEESFGPQR